MKPTTVLLFLLLLACWGPASVVADDRKVIPSIALKQEYSDNLYFDSQSRQSDFITTVSPGLVLVNNTERLKAGLKLQLDSAYYQDHTDMDSVDQDFSGNLGYAVSSRANLFTSGGYRRDSRVDSEFTQTGLVLSDVPRERYNYQLGGDYALSEVMGVKLAYTFNTEYYDSSQYADSQSNGISLELNRDLSEWLSSTVGRIRLGATDYNNDGTQTGSNGSQTKNYTGTIGAERKLDEQFSYFIDLGLRYTESTFDTYRLVPSGIPFYYFVVPYEDESNGTGLTGQTGLTYQGELNSAQLSLSHEVAAASGSNGTVERTALQCGAGRKLNETSRIALSAGYAMNKSTQDETNADTIDEQSIWLQPKLVYDFTEQWAVETSYSYSLVHDKEADTDSYRNLVLLRLVYQYK
jgi:hypothetical protein